ncbi:MAG: TetR/AcrR family transcriptional regulator [Pseudomonadota bacterium]
MTNKQPGPSAIPDPSFPPTVGAPRRRGRPSRDAEAMSREEILRRAFAAFAREGYDSVSLRSLAAACGVSDSLLTHHFGTKQQLWYEATDSVYAPLNARLMALLDALAGVGDAVTILQSNLPQAVKLMASEPVALQFLFREGEGNDERGEYIRRQYVHPYQARLDTLFDHAQEQGLYRRLSPASRYTLLFGLMRSLVMPGLMRNELAVHLVDAKCMDSYIDESVAILHRGFALTPRASDIETTDAAPSKGDAS